MAVIEMLGNEELLLTDLKWALSEGGGMMLLLFFLFSVFKELNVLPK
jgi:hypothetical protein